MIMRRFAVAFLFVFTLSVVGIAPAHAQGCGPTNPNCIVPTAPIGTNNNQAASTAFVQTAVTASSPPIYVTSYGALCDGVTDDTTAIQAALNSGFPNIYVASGTCLSRALTIPTTVKLLAGAGTLKCNGTIGAFGTFLLATNSSSLRIRDITIDCSSTTYSTVNSIAFVTGTNSRVQNIRFANAARFGVYLGGCVGCAVEGNIIQNFAQSSIEFSAAEGALTNIRIANNVITGNATQTGSTVELTAASTDTEMVDNWISVSSAGAFGINGQSMTRGIIARNVIRNTKAEAIAAFGTQTAIVDNDLSWDAGISTDYGLSSVAAGDSMVIARNRIYRPGKTCIAIGSTATRYIIENNQLIDCNNTNNATNGNGIEIVNSSNTHVVRQNYIVNQNTAFIRYCIREFNTADSNRFEGNYCYAAATGDYLTVGANSKIVWKYDLTATNPNGNITFLGTTVSSLTIGANALTLGGPTSLPAIVQGDLWFGSAANTISALAKSATATRYLANTGTSNNPAWDQINLANGVTGTLGVANGGSGASTFTSNGVLYGNGTGAIQVTTQGPANSVLTANAGVPAFSSTPNLNSFTIKASGAAPTFECVAPACAGFWLADAGHTTSQQIFFGSDSVTSNLFRIGFFGTGGISTNVIGVSGATGAGNQFVAVVGNVFVNAGAYSTAPTAKLEVGGTDASTSTTTGNVINRGGLGNVGSIVTGTFLSVGQATAPTLATGEIGIAKITASASAPGAGSLKFSAVAGTSAGTCKIIAYAGTSTTPTTIIDNVGAGC